MITNTFKQFETLDYVLMVNKANDNRLGSSLMYIYEQIQNMFGKDTVDRFIVMCTFSDGDQPLAVEAIRSAGFKIDKFLKFNNSAIFQNCKKNQNTKTYFNLGYESYKDFINYIIIQKKSPISMKLTQNVIKNRELIAEDALECAKSIQALT